MAKWVRVNYHTGQGQVGQGQRSHGMGYAQPKGHDIGRWAHVNFKLLNFTLYFQDYFTTELWTTVPVRWWETITALSPPELASLLHLDTWNSRYFKQITQESVRMFYDRYRYNR